MVKDGLDILKKQYRMMVLMTGAPIFGSLFVYWLLVDFLIPAPKVASGTDISMIKYVFYAIIMALAVAITLARNLLFKKRADGDLAMLIASLRVWSLVTMALCEAPAVLGLVLYFIGGSKPDFYVFLSISIVLFVMKFPRFRQWEEYAGEKIY